MRISDWSSDVCSSDLIGQAGKGDEIARKLAGKRRRGRIVPHAVQCGALRIARRIVGQKGRVELLLVVRPARADGDRQPIGDVEDIMREEGEILALLPQAVAGDTDIGDSVEDRKSTRLTSSH